MPQQQLDYETRLVGSAPVKRIVALVCVVTAATVYNVCLVRWKLTNPGPSPAATFINQGLAPFGNLILGGVFASIVPWLPNRGWSLLWYLSLCIGVPLVGWQVVEAVR